MKLNALKSICKENKTVVILNREGEQWIGDGCGFYLVENLPKMSETNLLTMFDVKPEKWAEWKTNECEAPDSICFENAIPGEGMFCPFRLGLIINETDLIIGNTKYGIMALDKKYLKPVEGMGYINIFVREMDGMVYFAVKQGFMLCAVIARYKVEKKEVRQELRDVMRWLEKDETIEDLMEDVYGKETMERFH